MGFGKGFAAGLGVALIIACILGMFAAWLIYAGYNEYKGDALEAYRLTHSEEYAGLIEGLETVKQLINQSLAFFAQIHISVPEEKIMDFYEKLDGYQQLLLKTKTATEKITPTKIYEVISIIQTISTLLGIIGAITVTAAVTLEIRERRRKPAIPPPPPPPQ